MKIYTGKMRKIIPLLGLLLISLALVYHSEQISADSEYYLELGERNLSQGDEGADVALLQQKLTGEGYYNYRIDGIFGPQTRKAVRKFQRDKGLAVDGIVGPNTLSHLPRGELLSRVSFQREEIIDLARVIYGEARGESFKGQIAVGAVVRNRVESDKFSDSIREVILEDGQFSSIYDGQANYNFPSEESIEAARAALLGYDPTRGALFFYNPEIANLEWISERPIITEIGNHVFAS